MKLLVENSVSSFFYYMWNAWSEDECRIVFEDMPKHFWDKWCSMADKGIFGAAERFFAELSENNQKLLVERAVAIYDGKARRKQPNDSEILVCEECGSQQLEVQVWVNIKTYEYLCEADKEFNARWCEECDDNANFCPQTEFIQKMQSWWTSCDFKTLERITELREIEYSSEDGSQAFVDAVNEWWSNQDYDKKRSIYNEYNSNN